MTKLGLDAVDSATGSLLEETVVPLTLAADRRINPGRWVLSPWYRNVDQTVFSDRAQALGWMNTHAGTAC